MARVASRVQAAGAKVAKSDHPGAAGAAELLARAHALLIEATGKLQTRSRRPPGKRIAKKTTAAHKTRTMRKKS